MRKILLAGCLLSITVATFAVHAAARRGLVVHEWGTFLAMNGSDGVTLDGMYHEEHALPAFVHARSRDELRLRTSNLKGETPVIYFYTDTPTQVRVEVGFPRGLWTQWYPQADYVGPSFVQTGNLPQLGKGRIAWSVNVVPASERPGAPPPTATDALWNYTRDVDAAFVSSASADRTGSPREWERFIFYRGLGEAGLPLNVSTTGGATLACGPDVTGGVRHVYLLRVERGRGAYRYVPSLRCGERLDAIVPGMDHAEPAERFAARLGADLEARLVESGLYAKEARGMVNTWRASYFATDGIRALFVLPQAWTDRFIPMKIEPAPDELVRVMVGRIELLTPERERAAETAVANLASPDAAIRDAAFATLREQGRYVEPVVRRVMQSSSDEGVRTLARRLLLTDFIADIRSSLTDAADGRPLVQEPVYARAQLASLLRQAGLVDEARDEGERALAALARMPRPTMTDHQSRNTFRAIARAYEGAGRDREALQWYNDFVEFGSGYRTCGGCHELAGPRDVAFFRDWWAGQRYAELAWKTGEGARMVSDNEAALARAPGSLLPQIRLAYLYDARGDTTRSARIWSKLDPRGDVRASAAR